MLALLRFVPIIAVLVIYVMRLLEVKTKRAVIKGTVQETATFNLFMVSGLIAVFGGIAEYCWLGLHPRWEFVLAGIALALASFKIRGSAIAALGKYWSLHIEIRENHQFVRSGPFRWMRHPTYFSMVFELLSVILILDSFVSGIVAFLIFTPTMARRISLEEKAMVEKFGDEYRTYQKKKPLLFPTRIP